MRNSLLFLGAAMVGIAASHGSVSAQSVGVYVGPAYDDYYYYDGPRTPRTYRYSGSADGIVVRRYSSGGCGTYRYWDGDRCVDARWK